MAGNGGFKNALNGFDKNEVNQYISDMSKKRQELEAELSDAKAKAASATKAAAEAEGKVDDLIKSHNAKVQELEAQIKTERRNADNLQNEVDELKRKLRNAGSASPGIAKPNTAEAERKSAEIIENANAAARDIVEKAKQTAKQVMANAENAAKSAGAAGGSGVSAEALNAFRDILSGLTGTVTNALKTANEKASEISVSAGGAPVHVEMPDLSGFETLAAAVPERHEPPKPSKPAPAASDGFGGMDDMFADMMGSGSDSMSGFGDLKTDDSSDILHSNASNDVVEEFDLSGMGSMGGAMDELSGGFSNDFGDPFADMASEVAPLEKKKQGGAAPDDNFAADLLAQTVPGSALGDQLDNDMFSVVRELEEKAAVKPAEEDSGFDMGSSSSADSGLDAMNALLGQMGSMLENAGGSASDHDMDLGSSSGGSMADDNPWADFQNQIEALEQSAGKAAEQPSQPDPFMNDSMFADPKVPDADDNSIWNFDDMGSSSSDDDMNSGSDDDMSSDLFGSF